MQAELESEVFVIFQQSYCFPLVMAVFIFPQNVWVPKYVVQSPLVQLSFPSK